MDKNIYTLLLQSILRHLFYNIFLCFFNYLCAQWLKKTITFV